MDGTAGRGRARDSTGFRRPADTLLLDEAQQRRRQRQQHGADDEADAAESRAAADHAHEHRERRDMRVLGHQSPGRRKLSATEM
jgi:hypothetical protein